MIGAKTYDETDADMLGVDYVLSALVKDVEKLAELIGASEFKYVQREEAATPAPAPRSAPRNRPHQC